MLKPLAKALLAAMILWPMLPTVSYAGPLDASAQVIFVGRNNYLKPNPRASGPHTTFKRNSAGRVTNYATWKQNPRNPSGYDLQKRVDITGGVHTNPNGQKVPTPHVEEAGKRGVRPATRAELPK